MRFPDWFKPLMVLIVAAWLTWSWFGPSPPAPAPGPRNNLKNIKLAFSSFDDYRPFDGSSSCAAARCHGGQYDPQRPAWNSAYSVWRTDDPHARAYAALLSPRGQEMAQRYFVDEEQTRPEQDQRCLACHVTQRPLAVVVDEGVGCASCHGDSTYWRDTHYLPEWNATRSAPGFHDLRKPSERARSCVSCHVGGPGREVSHDLIAAGHPPLRFELGAFHEQLPKHWDFAREKTNDPHIEARLWLAGQIESSRAALDLLNQRLASSHGVWPEFAEYDCESCHHPITASRPRPGIPIWGSWHFSPRSVDALFIGDDRLVQQQLIELRRTLANLSALPNEVQPLVQVLRAMWPKSEVADDLALSEAQWLSVRDGLKRAPTAVDRTWSAAAQRWLALTALDPSPPDDRKDALQAMRRHLQVPARFDPKIMESLERSAKE